MAGRSKNRYAHLTSPQRELDFHGLGPLTGQNIKKMTESFVAEARADGLERVRIVTGRGRHSRGGRPVVKPQVQRTLDALVNSGDVMTWSTAKDTEGGDGALDVRLA